MRLFLSFLQAINSFWHKNNLRMVLSAFVAIVILSVDYWAMNCSIPLGSEKAKLQVLEYLKQRITGTQANQISDSVLMLDVHYDKVMVTERKQASDGTWMEMGQVPVTDRGKLLRSLQYLKKRGDYRYILLDIRLEASTNQPEDTTLWEIISNMPRLVMAHPLNSEIASPLLNEKAGAAQYNVVLWETDFLKYPIYTDTIPSMALKMYQETTNHNIQRWGPLWVDGYRLARSSMILTWDLVDFNKRFYLGDIIGDWEDGDGEEWDGSPNGKYILIGDFEEDVHPTFFGEMSGTLLIYNAYQSLLQHRHTLSPFLIITLFSLFVVLAWLTLSKNHFFSWLCSFWGYAGFLTLFCIFTYLTFNVVYDILITTLLFYALKTGVEWYDRRYELFIYMKRIINYIKL